MNPPTEDQIKRAAEMLAAAYWRGRLADIAEQSPLTAEAMIAAAAKLNVDHWRGTAREALT